MYGIKAVLALGLLLTAADARPDGYGGVKGGRNHKSTANAFATAQATAHADGGYLGTAQSSASATANAVASGGTSNAAATANAYADGGNIGKVIGSDDANRNANPLGDSDSLRLSSVHAKDSENQSDNQEDGTSVGRHHNVNTGSYGNSGSVGVTGQSQDRRPGCGVPAGVKGHRGASGCTDRNGAEENKPSGSDPHPAYNGNPDSSAGSKYPKSPDGGYGGNIAGAQPCTSGASGCPKNKPSVSNSYPTNNGNPDLSTGSKYPTSPDGGYGGNTAGTQPCTSGASGCSKNKPSVSNPYPTYNGNPDLSAGTKYPTSPDGSYGGNNAMPEPPSCSAGAPGCSGHKPSVSNPHAVYPGYADSSPDSQHAVDINHRQVEGHAGRPQDTPCFPGDPRCLAGSKPKPTTPDPSTAGIIESGPIPCAAGSVNCPNTKPGVINQYPTHQENPDLSGGSKYPTNPNGGYGGKAPTAGGNPSSGSSPYPGSSRKPDTSNPFLNGEIDVSGIKDSVNTGVGSDIKTNPENPFLNPHSQVRPSTCTKHPEKPNGSYGGSPTAPGYPHGGSSGDSTSPPIKTNPSNPFLSHNGNVDAPNHVQHPGVSTNLPTGQGYPAVNGGCHGSISCTSNKPEHPPSSSEYPVKKPNPSNPFLSHNGNGDSTYGVNHPGAGSGIPQNSNLPTAQVYPAANGGCHGSTTCLSNKPEHPPSSSEYPVKKPNPSNPFLSHNGNVDSTYGVNHPGAGSGIPQNTNLPTAQGYPATNGGCHGSTSCGPNKPGHTTGSPEYPVNKPNPSNPFLPHNGEVEKTTGIKYPDLKPPVLKNPGSFGESSYDRIDPHSNDKKNYGSQDVPHTYPDLKPPVLKNPGSFGESSYDLIDPHSNDKKNYGSQDVPHTYPDLKPPVLKNPGSFGESSYDRIDPHSNDKKNYGSQDVPHTYPDLKPPVLKNPGSFGESSYDLIDPHSKDKKNYGSQNGPSMYPGTESTGSNPYLGDDQVTNQHPKPGSHETPNSPKPYPGHNIAESPSTEWKPEAVNGYYGNGNAHGIQNQGVKTHQPGVKGGSRRREPPAKLEETELLSGNMGSAYSTAHASASASAHSSAYASSSSSSGGGHSSAKSDAYSDFGSSGSNNSWASSSASASASASAFASSSSHQGSENWQFPDVPAE